MLLPKVPTIRHRIGGPTIYQSGEVMIALGLPCMLGYVVLGIDHPAIGIFAWVRLGLHGLGELVKKLRFDFCL